MAEDKKVKKIKLQDKVNVVATDKHPFAEKGEKFSIHPTLAAQFLKAGYIAKYSGGVEEETEPAGE